VHAAKRHSHARDATQDKTTHHPHRKLKLESVKFRVAGENIAGCIICQERLL